MNLQYSKRYIGQILPQIKAINEQLLKKVQEPKMAVHAAVLF